MELSELPNYWKCRLDWRKMCSDCFSVGFWERKLFLGLPPMTLVSTEGCACRGPCSWKHSFFSWCPLTFCAVALPEQPSPNPWRKLRATEIALIWFFALSLPVLRLLPFTSATVCRCTINPSIHSLICTVTKWVFKELLQVSAEQLRTWKWKMNCKTLYLGVLFMLLLCDTENDNVLFNCCSWTSKLYKAKGLKIQMSFFPKPSFLP